MTKAVVLILTVGIVATSGAIVFTLNYVPSPFAAVVSRGDTIIATPHRGLLFMVSKPNSNQLEHIDASKPLELRNGETVRLGSGQRSYQVACRTSPPPVGLWIQGEWHLHDFPRSFVKKWFISAK